MSGSPQRKMHGKQEGMRVALSESLVRSAVQCSAAAAGSQFDMKRPHECSYCTYIEASSAAGSSGLAGGF